MRRPILLAAFHGRRGPGRTARADRPERIRRRARGERTGRGASSPTGPTARSSGCSPGEPSTRPPRRARRQVEFRLDYSGGSGKFSGSCGAYDGPALAWKVTACRAPDGSYWALQAWQRGLPNYGVAPSPPQAVWELRLSHWTGEPAELTIKTDWAYRRYDHLYGSFTYNGGGVFGFRSTRFGVPLDRFGRNVYVDTFNSAYGAGWKRENSFQPPSRRHVLLRLYPHGARPVGRGTKYRATVIGPGVTPDVFWEAPAPGAYDRAADLAANDDQRAGFRDGVCKIN